MTNKNDVRWMHVLSVYICAHKLYTKCTCCMCMFCVYYLYTGCTLCHCTIYTPCVCAVGVRLCTLSAHEVYMLKVYVCVHYLYTRCMWFTLVYPICTRGVCVHCVVGVHLCALSIHGAYVFSVYVCVHYLYTRCMCCRCTFAAVSVSTAYRTVCSHTTPKTTAGSKERPC